MRQQKAKRVRVNRLLRTARIRKEYSQQQLSAYLEMSHPQMVSNYERNLCDIPPKYLVKACKVLDINTDDLRLSWQLDSEAQLEEYMIQGEEDVQTDVSI